MSDTPVIPFKVVPSSRLTISGEAIELCESILADLRSGKTIAVGFVAVGADGMVATGWAGRNCTHHLTSGATTLMVRMAAE